MQRLAHFPFFPRDFISDPRVTLMSNAEVGAYMRLLCHAWAEGGIPADRRLRARVMHEPLDDADEMWHAIGPCWHPGPTGLLVNRRMEQEREKATANYTRQVEQAANAREAKSRAKARANPCANPITQNSELRTKKEQNTETPCPADDVRDVVNRHRTALGLTKLRGDKTGTGYVNGRIDEYDLATVLAVAEYAPTDPWIADGQKLTLQAIFSPKSFPVLLDRMENPQPSEGDRKMLSLYRDLDQVAL